MNVSVLFVGSVVCQLGLFPELFPTRRDPVTRLFAKILKPTVHAAGFNASLFYGAFSFGHTASTASGRRRIFCICRAGRSNCFSLQLPVLPLEALLSTYLISHLESKVLTVAVVASRVLEKYDRTEVSVLANQVCTVYT